MVASPISPPSPSPPPTSKRDHDRRSTQLTPLTTTSSLPDNDFGTIISPLDLNRDHLGPDKSVHKRREHGMDGLGSGTSEDRMGPILERSPEVERGKGDNADGTFRQQRDGSMSSYTENGVLNGLRDGSREANGGEESEGSTSTFWPEIMEKVLRDVNDDIVTRDDGVNGCDEREARKRDTEGLGLVLDQQQEKSENGVITKDASLDEIFEAADPDNGLSRETSPHRRQDKEKGPLKLSPAKIQELTSSPQSIPYRAVPSESGQRRRVVSDDTHTTVNGSGPADGEKSPRETKLPDTFSRFRPNGAPYLEESPELIGPALKQSTSSARTRPHASRTISTPSSSRRRLSSSTNERLSQAWLTRSKNRQNVSRAEPDVRNHLSPSAQIVEPAIPSPLPPAIPVPPLSLPTYLQLELASGRPSPLYIHRSATTDFPYESSRVKLERLTNFLVLPPALERVLWFGILACLDAWLYSFTILPLRFCKAIYILLESWAVNLGAEFRFISGFIIKGVGRVWRRRARSAADTLERVSESEARSPAVGNMKQDLSPAERENKNKIDQRRRRRSDTHRPMHRRQKSIPSDLLPDDKADILKGLLMITTCTVLMYFDASRMYHWIRGQAAIKLYVIYNVLEVSDRLFAAIGQDVLECLFSREALERKPDGRSKVFRPFWLFLLALAYTVIHSTALFYQVMTLNVAVNSYSNALITLLLSNQFVEIKSTVFKKFEKENLFQLTCADVVERFQLWLMLTIIASRNIVETGAFNFFGTLGSSFSSNSSTSSNSTPLSTPPRTSSSILPKAFTIFPSSLISSFSSVNSFLPTLVQVLGPFLVVLGSEMLVDWLKHAYINKFNNTRPAIYGRFLDILAKDYYNNAFGEQNLTRRLGLPIIPLSCLFFRVSVQTYKMFLAALLPQNPSSTASEATSLSSIHSKYVPAPAPSTPPLTLRTLFSSSAAHINSLFRAALANAMPSPAQSVYIFTVVLLLTGFIVLLVLKLLLGMLLLNLARSRYKMMKSKEVDHNHHGVADASSSSHQSEKSRGKEYSVDGSRRVGGWGVVEVNDDKRRWIYADDPEGLKRLKAKEEKEKTAVKDDEMSMEHVQRYDMVAKRIW
ncbi:cytomegalovirus gH-receptor family protein [Aspergillus sclerotialis]|uniref:Cytomegalovirus gH-receptor family protein n=1 Tax=Aspergillus sclerotialis TaxID=2070753 RepID=A0A3A2ZAL5_9EURO|nr:cytomegalovirus gH-receptor family protein [Aspergillus sclerotialis]